MSNNEVEIVKILGTKEVLMGFERCGSACELGEISRSKRLFLGAFGASIIDLLADRFRHFNIKNSPGEFTS